MDFEQIFDGIGLEQEGRESFWKLHARRDEPDFAAAIAEGFRIFEEGDPAFGSFLEGFATREQLPAEVLNLYFYLLKAAKTYGVYTEKGIDPEVFNNTLGDIAIYCKMNREQLGVYGIPQRIYRRWLRRYFECRIYQLGHLRFELIPCTYEAVIGDLSVSKGNRVLSVHIPGGKPLEEDACESAYAQARVFFRKHYAMETPVFYCASWLLQPWLPDALPETSRIVKFQSKYQILDFVDDPEDVTLWVFPQKCENIEDYPEDTIVRRTVKNRLRRGEVIGYGAGVRL